MTNLQALRKTLVYVLIAMGITSLIMNVIQYRNSLDHDCNIGEYQITLEIDGTAFIWDNQRYVGHVDFDSCNAYTKVFIKDNE